MFIFFSLEVTFRYTRFVCKFEKHMIPLSLDIKSLSYSYEDKVILENLSFQLKQGEFVTFVGPSGSGKTTLFKLLSGIIPIQKGIISSLQSKPNIAYMMQEDLLLPWRTLLENVLIFTELGPCITSSKEIKEEAEQLLNEMGLVNCLHYYPHQLSGGMRQRAALVRTLLQKKPLILLDEPFNAMDVALREQTYAYLKKQQQEKEVSILMVTHDFLEAACLSDRIIMLKNGSIHQTWVVQQEDRHNPLKLHSIQDAIRQEMLSYTLDFNPSPIYQKRHPK